MQGTRPAAMAPTKRRLEAGADAESGETKAEGASGDAKDAESEAISISGPAASGPGSGPGGEMDPDMPEQPELTQAECASGGP
jgi:hypothetical protein